MDGSLISNVRQNSGFFANFLMFCDNLEYCDRNNLKPILTMKGPWFYNQTQSDYWNNFFQPLNDGIIEGPEIHASTLGGFTLWNESFVCLRGKVPIWDLYGNHEMCQKNRENVNRVIVRFKPINYLQTQIDNFLYHYFLNKKVLGIHCRTTDYHFYNLSSYEKDVNFSDYDVIFIASDSREPINYFKKKYRNVVSYETNLRMDRMNMGVLPRNISAENSIKHGQDVLIETYLLSKCNHIICINSNVAASALYLNPSITFKLIHRYHEGG